MTHPARSTIKASFYNIRLRLLVCGVTNSGYPKWFHLNTISRDEQLFFLLQFGVLRMRGFFSINRIVFCSFSVLIVFFVHFGIACKRFFVFNWRWLIFTSWRRDKIALPPSIVHVFFLFVVVVHIGMRSFALLSNFNEINFFGPIAELH